ncbi:unnamed protein product [Echinostoma caproni]|uniref:Uncharacterized protein n=1 Tax=Echinostoma caproni TaxID=27848 RepID=A0A183AAX9_9TREM|nr:unnamed protein product [Echinostoma caproni]
MDDRARSYAGRKCTGLDADAVEFKLIRNLPPTIDETVLTSLNCIANLLISNRPPNGYDILFEAALRLGVFESIFRWNFVFCGADLEAFKAKELQFYDTLITGEGKQYLRYPEFAIPLLATLHHCAIRSSLPVERVLVRTLNSVCAAMCAQFSESDFSYTTSQVCNGTKESGIELTEDLSFFRRLSMGLVTDFRHHMGFKLNRMNEDASQSLRDFNGFNPDSGSFIKMADTVDWPLSIEPDPSGSTDAAITSLERSLSFTSQDSSCNIDSIFDLLIPFVFREGDLGWQARDAFLLVATYSNKDEDFSYNLAQHSSVCPVIATGLATLYAELPRELISNNYPQSWPELVQTMEEREQNCSQFIEFFSALEFCESVLEVAHPLIQSSLLQFIHSGFFVSVLGFSLTKPNVLEVITATVLLKEILVRTTNSAILPALLRFLLTAMPEEKHSKEIKGLTQDSENKSESDVDRTSTLSAPTPRQSEGIDHEEESCIPAYRSTSTYMDLLISRLHYCNTLTVDPIAGLNAETKADMDDVIVRLKFGLHLKTLKNTVSSKRLNVLPLKNSEKYQKLMGMIPAQLSNDPLGTHGNTGSSVETQWTRMKSSVQQAALHARGTGSRRLKDWISNHIIQLAKAAREARLAQSSAYRDLRRQATQSARNDGCNY